MSYAGIRELSYAVNFGIAKLLSHKFAYYVAFGASKFRTLMKAYEICEIKVAPSF